MLSSQDQDIRGALTRAIARLGYAPPIDVLSRELGLTDADVTMGLQRLAHAHALLLHPGTCRPWVVHPFALSPGSCWVQTANKGYWANCLYCACGIGAALGCDATIHTRYGGEAQPALYEIRDGQLCDSGDIFHLSTPAARWWDNVIFACSSFQPFKSARDLEDWCRRHDLPKGAIMTLPQLWEFARDWYGHYLARPWKKRSVAEAESVFQRNGLTGPFWSLRA